MRKSKSPKTRIKRTAESVFQSLVVNILKRHGFITFEMGKSALNKGRGLQRGFPDLMITHEDWIPCAWVGIELKSEYGTLTVEQRLLHDIGRIHVSRNLRSIADCLEAFEMFTHCSTQSLASLKGELRRNPKL